MTQARFPFLRGYTPFRLYDYRDKQRAVDNICEYMLARTSRMFELENLPETIPHRELMMMLQGVGHVCITPVNGQLYAFVGGWGGGQNEYYMPTQYTVANPALDFNATLDIGKDCVVIGNDSAYKGLGDMFSRYATMLAETEISLQRACVNSRALAFISAPDDRSAASALDVIDKLESGESGVAGDNAFLDGIRVQAFGSAGNGSISGLLELEQYAKASLWQELGLDANYNMKREAIMAGEASLNADALLPLVDDMQQFQQLGWDKCFELWPDLFPNGRVVVKLASAWEDNAQELEAAQDAAEAQGEPMMDGEAMPEADVEGEAMSEEPSEAESGAQEPSEEGEPNVQEIAEQVVEFIAEAIEPQEEEGEANETDIDAD